jgi:hypothetical protein
MLNFEYRIQYRIMPGVSTTKNKLGVRPPGRKAPSQPPPDFQDAHKKAESDCWLPPVCPCIFI